MQFRFQMSHRTGASVTCTTFSIEAAGRNVRDATPCRCSDLFAYINQIIVGAIAVNAYAKSNGSCLITEIKQHLGLTMVTTEQKLCEMTGQTEF